MGTVVGVGLILFGQEQVNDSDDGLLFSNGDQREMGEEAGAAGATVTGYSLFVAGIGLVLLVMGIVVGGKERLLHQQQQQVVIVNGNGPPLLQTQQRPPMI
ncbi:MAG TPA: hypothetical protein VI818_00885 [Candidatus Thermoplasmatota archaeon]|nr:hypothetical protein [Candidatus Thermoplasmatota archaeon]